MAWAFGDGFDCYAAPADAFNGYWDSGVASTATLVAGRFSGSQALSMPSSTTFNLVKSSGQNDAVHHLVYAFRQTTAISGTTLGAYLQLLDGTTAQCSIVHRSDGAILLTSGGPAGAVLDTYTGAVSVINTWYAFECEVVISNTVGRLRVRKNGNPVDDYDSTAIRDTQNSANAYANKLQVGEQAAVNAHQLDDLYWRSDASSVAWMGDIRAYTRMPASDASVQFARAAVSTTQTLGAQNTTAANTSGLAHYDQFIPSASGVISQVNFNLGVAGMTGHVMAAIYDNTGIGGNPGSVLATSNPITNPVIGFNALTFPSPVHVSRGQTYWVAFDQDASATYNVSSSVLTSLTNTTAYASFPVTAPAGFTTGQRQFYAQIIYLATQNNDCVNEPQQDATTSYVYDSVVGHSDLYGIAPIASTPLVTHAVVTRAYMIKSDSGTRTAAVQLKSGGTTVASPTVVLTTSNWQWAWRHDTTDPQTGTAWTAAAVNLVNVGPLVVA
jgi:hypothetical protein